MPTLPRTAQVSNGLTFVLRQRSRWSVLVGEAGPPTGDTATDKTFDLDEYAAAGRDFFSKAVNAVARADGLLSLIRVEHADSLPIMQSTVASGQVVESSPMRAEAQLVFDVAQDVDGDFDQFHVAIAKAAQDYSAQLVPQILEHMSQICDATGQTVDAADLDIWEGQLRVLETIAISFDEDGVPTLPTLILHPDTADRAGDPPPEFRSRFEEILVRRRDEWLAGRRHRRIPRQRHRA